MLWSLSFVPRFSLGFLLSVKAYFYCERLGGISVELCGLYDSVAVSVSEPKVAEVGDGTLETSLCAAERALVSSEQSACRCTPNGSVGGLS